MAATTTGRRVKVGVVQLAMRDVGGLGGFFETAGAFVRSLAGYGVDFVVFPEYVNGGLMAGWPELGAAGAVRELAKAGEATRAFFIEQAQAAGVNVVAGSFPVERDGGLVNASYLCRRDGTWEEQLKVHVTPSEEEAWAMAGGTRVRAFDTDVGRVGILVCYDSEFPELGRLLAEDGAEIVFVPFCTDGEAGYHRVRRCSQARAVENECYVVLSGSVGCLPQVPELEFQYARSAVFSPADAGFPADGVVCEAAAGEETVLVAELDLDVLGRLRSGGGSVRNLAQRRKDLYRLDWT